MNFAGLIARTALVGALLSAGVAFAEGDATEPNALLREGTMQAIGGSMKVLGDMAGGKAAFDATAAATAKAKLIEAAAQIPTSFATQGDADPTSEAKPAIWTDWDAFLKHAQDLKAAGEAADVSSVDTIKVSMGTLGGVCKECHTDFRDMK